MPAKSPRVNIVVEPSLYSIIRDLAFENGMSMSTLARDLIKEALELREDISLASLAEERESSFDRKKALTHRETWN